MLHATRPNPDIQRSTKTRRREKKNKYKQFSKISSRRDPLEELIADCEKKNQELKAEKKRVEEKKIHQSKLEPKIAPLPSLEFPDTKAIDVSSPQKVRSALNGQV